MVKNNQKMKYDILQKMIVFSAGNIHDIDHLIRVWTYAKTIAEMEGIDKETQLILEVASIVHDIACPLCREKYGNTKAKYQEEEGSRMVFEFLGDSGMRAEQIARISYLVGHHHTIQNIDGMDYQILIEADYIANALENKWNEEDICKFRDTIMRTESGKQLVTDIFQI